MPSAAVCISCEISIHALCEEGDLSRLIGTFLISIFLSTPSARRATKIARDRAEEMEISIHALCEEGDGISSFVASFPFNFYPRPLRGGRLAYVPPL